MNTRKPGFAGLFVFERDKEASVALGCAKGDDLGQNIGYTLRLAYSYAISKVYDL